MESGIKKLIIILVVLAILAGGGFYIFRLLARSCNFSQLPSDFPTPSVIPPTANKNQTPAGVEENNQPVQPGQPAQANDEIREVKGKATGINGNFIFVESESELFQLGINAQTPVFTLTGTEKTKAGLPDIKINGGVSVKYDYLKNATEIVIGE
ncbi:MAG: hypothetical protein V1804_02965 [Patescibacteria group bacterium]